MRLSKKMLTVTLILLAIMAVVSLYASANTGFTFSSFRPEPGSTVNTTSTTVRAYVVSDFNLNASSATIRIGSTTYPATFTQRYSAKDGFITYSATNLRDGLTEVQASIRDINNNTGSYTWQFTVRVPPVISELTPANGSSHQTVNLIRAKAVDPNGTIVRIVLKLNGIVIPEERVSYDAMGYVSYAPDNLAARAHNVELYVEDNSGNGTTAAWSFTTTNQPPVFNTPNPASDLTVNTGTPLISVRVEDANSQISSTSAGMTLAYGGQSFQVPATFNYDTGPNYYKGTISYRPATALPDGRVEVFATIRNSAGVLGSYAWPFTVAVPPVISSMVPGNNAVVNAVNEISAVVRDPNGSIDPQSVTMKVNNSTVQHTYDQATGKVSLVNPGGFTDGVFSVVLDVSDMAGNRQIAAWSFTLNTVPPEFKNIAPLDGSLITANDPDIRVTIEDPNRIKSGTPNMFLNQRQVSSTFAYHQYYNQHWQLVTDYTKGTLSYKPSALLNGEYEVRATAEDEPGNSGFVLWTFTVAAPPKILEIYPAPSATLGIQRPVVTVDLSVQEELTLEKVVLRIQGRDVVPEITPLGAGVYRLSYQPAANWPDEEIIQLELTVRGYNGCVTTRNWTYYINTRGEMPGTDPGIATCSMCHNGVSIKQRLCGQCHSTSISSWQGRCFDCHLAGAPPITHHRYSTYPHNILTDHDVASEEMIGCGSCHSRYLSREHNRNNYTCSTCHAHESLVIQQAISTNQRNCFACHTGEAASLVHPGHTVTLGDACAGCHGNSMMTENIRHDKDCGSCHNSSDSLVRSAILWQKDSCFDCHKQPHGVVMTVKRDDIPWYGDLEWSTPQIASIWGGEGWLPEALENEQARIMFSSRKQMDTETVYQYYRTEMAAGGWVLTDSSYTAGEPVFQLSYQKGRRLCLIWFYTGDMPNTAGNSPAGARVTIAYH